MLTHVLGRVTFEGPTLDPKGDLQGAVGNKGPSVGERSRPERESRCSQSADGNLRPAAGGEQNAEGQVLRTGRDKKYWVNVFLSGGRYT